MCGTPATGGQKLASTVELTTVSATPASASSADTGEAATYFYNRAVTNVNVSVVHNTYNTTVINNSTTINRVSFNGGQGGVRPGQLLGKLLRSISGMSL